MRGLFDDILKTKGNVWVIPFFVDRKFGVYIIYFDTIAGN